MNEFAYGEYSLWLTLEERTDASIRYQDTIADLTKEHDDAPVFEPHVTVLGGFDGTRETLVEITRSLANETEPIDVAFGAIRCSTTTHQCVFQLVEPTLSLFELYETARDALDVPQAPYNPHVSLIYSGMGFEERFALVDDIDSASLPGAGQLTTLKLVATSGPVADWEPVCTVEL